MCTYVQAYVTTLPQGSEVSLSTLRPKLLAHNQNNEVDKQRLEAILENRKVRNKPADAVGSAMAPVIYREHSNLVLAKTIGDMIIAPEVLCIAVREKDNSARRIWHPALVKQLVPGGA